MNPFTLHTDFLVDMIPCGKSNKPLPAVLGREEETCLFTHVPQALERLMLQTAYACGLRAFELLAFFVFRVEGWLEDG